jgi:hypothetical protein
MVSFRLCVICGPPLAASGEFPVMAGLRGVARPADHAGVMYCVVLAAGSVRFA